MSFIIDCKYGIITEDEEFELHYQQLQTFLHELFHLSCGRGPPASIQRILQQWTSSGGGKEVASRWWNLIGGDIASSVVGATSGTRGGLMKSSWAQVDDMTMQLLHPFSTQVNIYTSLLSWIDGERILAVYPEQMKIPCIEWLKTVLTFGLNYCVHWSKQRREGAIILTDRRLIQVSCRAARYSRSMKVDFFVMGGTVKYLTFEPPQHFWACKRLLSFILQPPPGRILLATRCGPLELKLPRLEWAKACKETGQLLWHGLMLLQDALPVENCQFENFDSVQTEETACQPP